MPIARHHVVLITGASTGIGEAIALELAPRGVRLALAARNAIELERVASTCRDRGSDAIAIVTDVGVEASCNAFIDAAVAHFGRIDTLINNAGITMWAAFEEIVDLSMAERIMRVNYLGSVWCTHRALPHLRASGGRLAAVSSLAGLSGVPTRTLYAASKHAVRGFFDSLRIELAGSGVTVTVAYPGFVSTRVRERAFGADGRPLGTSPVREAEVMTPAECAGIILRALDDRRREVVMTARGRVGRWLKLIAPALVDRVAARAIASGK
jgi:NAD(P)-dependent dehydrogenase (short-subunit alcohol dehydrogenase family)